MKLFIFHLESLFQPVQCLMIFRSILVYWVKFRSDFFILWYPQELWVYPVVVANEKTRMHWVLSHWCGWAVVWFQAVAQLYVAFQSLLEILVSLILLPCLGGCFQDYVCVAVSRSWVCSALSTRGIWSVIWTTVPVFQTSCFLLMRYADLPSSFSFHVKNRSFAAN